MPSRKIMGELTGTCTRLIAIMLGRLEMDVDECIAVYTTLMEAVFAEKKNRSRVNMWLNLQPRFDTKKLKAAIEGVLESRGIAKDAPFNDGASRSCRVYASFFLVFLSLGHRLTAH